MPSQAFGDRVFLPATLSTVSRMPRPRDVVELAALARTLELGGIYNGAKLVRAVVERDLLRLADERRPAAGDEAARALEALADRTLADGDPVLATALRASAVAARTDAPLTNVDAPPVFTCRTCGELVTGTPPAVCPRCEAPALVFREHVATWYLEPMTSAEALAALEAGRSAVAAAIVGRDDATLTRRPKPGEWSARDTLEHLASTESLLAERLPRLLGEDDPELVASAAWAETATDDATVATGDSASTLLARFGTLRDASLVLLRNLDEDGWSRSGRHPEWGRVTVRSQASYFARHQASLMAQLAAAADGRVPGEGR